MSDKSHRIIGAQLLPGQQIQVELSGDTSRIIPDVTNGLYVTGNSTISGTLTVGNSIITTAGFSVTTPCGLIPVGAVVPVLTHLSTSLSFATTDVNEPTNTITYIAHGLTNGTLVTFSSTGTLPGGLVALVVYYIVNATADTFQVSLSLNGTVVDITSVGSGTHTVTKGAYNCTATTVSDVHGFVQCNGQVLSDATSPLNGATVPNVNNDVFLAGHTTSGTTGGSNAVTISSAQLPPHTHVSDHSHAAFVSGAATIVNTGAASPATTSDATPLTTGDTTTSTTAIGTRCFTDTESASHTHSGVACCTSAHTHGYEETTTTSINARNSVDQPAVIGNFEQSVGSSPAGGHAHSLSFGTQVTPGLATANHQHSISHTHSLQSHTHNAPHSHTYPHTHCALHTHPITIPTVVQGSSPGGFANTAVENRPSYITAKYVIRVK